MKQVDVLIAGGGLAGSLAAAMLGRAGIAAILVDPHAAYPEDFRCEKLDPVQLATLRLTGIADAVYRASTPDVEAWVVRHGLLVERRPGDQRGILYDTLVNTVRTQIPDSVELIEAKVSDLVRGPEWQSVTLSTGEEISARLVVAATGLNAPLRGKAGIRREVISANHTTAIGFDAMPVEPAAFPFGSLAYYSEKPSNLMSYITLFPIGAILRANMFSYRAFHDPWHKQFRDSPQETLYALWPGLRKFMGDYMVPGRVKIRPVDLYVSHDYLQDGVVLVGDAFSTSCPAAGTGARKVLVDVERLCNVHIPQWLSTPGMAAGKIAGFYADPVKRACDDFCHAKAFHVRSYSIDPSARWEARRRAKFVAQGARGILRRLVSSNPPPTSLPPDARSAVAMDA